MNSFVVIYRANEAVFGMRNVLEYCDCSYQYTFLLGVIVREEEREAAAKRERELK